MANQSKEQRVGRSHSLKETARKEKKEVAQQQQQQGLPSSLKQKITNVLYPDRDSQQHDQLHKESRAAVSHAPQGLVTVTAAQPSLYTALDSCLYLAAQGK